MNASRTLFATTPKGVESILTDELRALGAESVAETRSGVSFEGDLELAYRACLWSRLASRILLPLAEFQAATPEELYDGVQTIDWSEHLTAEGTLAVDCSLSRSAITHSKYAALKVKDAIVDQFRDRCGVRPSVELQRPDIRVNLYVHRDRATISLDLSGESLHRRGYRQEGAMAPLKENLAAAILIKAGWPEMAKEGGALLDPMCGSGTLPIEGAMIAADIAPGLLRTYFGFFGWLGHDAALWESLIEEAGERRTAGLESLPTIIGYDGDPRAIKAAWINAEGIGLQSKLHFERRQIATLAQPAGRPIEKGLVVVNPPYGERLGETEELLHLYANLGARLKENFPGWNGAIFTGNPELGKRIGIRAHRRHTLYNGALKCMLIHLRLEPEWFVDQSRPPRSARTATPIEELGPGAEMFANRLRKNLKSVGKWARKNDIHCYRVYDSDLPEYAVAVDLYEDWVHVQEYAAPKTVDPDKAEARLKEVMAVIPQVLETPAENVFLKVRRQQKGTSQYNKFDAQKQFHEVQEGNCRFLVNFTDYLDTGLFLDHRPTRQMIQEMADGKRFLNLFAYTGTASVHAAMGGALSTTTVDMSKTYLSWARKNLALNGFSDFKHDFVQANCVEWLENENRRFGLIFLDPPTFSNSKNMEESFDVQRDHVRLLKAAANLLVHDGVLIFSNNNRRFKIDREALPDLKIEDMTRKSIPKDFERNPNIHNCWKITRSR